MTSTSKLFLLLFASLLVCAPVSQVNADNELLKVRPKKCVTLRKGQVCYRNIKISFMTKEPSDYCLHINDDKTPLKCWSESSNGKLNIQFQSDKTEVFSLYDKSGTLIASSRVTIAWVHKSRSRRRAGWRLF